VYNNRSLCALLWRRGRGRIVPTRRALVRTRRPRPTRTDTRTRPATRIREPARHRQSTGGTRAARRVVQQRARGRRLQLDELLHLLGLLEELVLQQGLLLVALVRLQLQVLAPHDEAFQCGQKVRLALSVLGSSKKGGLQRSGTSSHVFFKIYL